MIADWTLGLRNFVHTLLGDQIVYLALAGFFFAALAGFGLFLAFDDLDTQGRSPHKFSGQVLAVLSIGLGTICLILGLP